MDIPPNKQLVPYYPEHRQVMPGASKTLAAAPASADRSSKRYRLLLLPTFSGDKTRPDHREPAYNSNHRLITPKINQVGLLIDIYA